VLERSWLFRTVGYGHGEKTWRDIMSTLRATDYDYVVSIEHEDSLLSVDEGLRKAVAFLQPLIVKEERPEIWWA
jgi:sugar phosphate isomerase/epimerase